MTGEPANPAQPKSANSLRRWALLTAKLVLTVVLTWLILRGAGFQAADARGINWRAVRPDGWLLVLSAAPLVADWLLGAWIWSRLAEGFGGSRLPLRTSASIILLANLGRYIPGRFLHVAGLALLARKAGLGIAVAAAASVVGQGLHLFGAALIGGWTAYQMSLSFGIRPQWVLAGAVVAGIAVYALVARFDGFKKLLSRATQRLARLGGGSSGSRTEPLVKPVRVRVLLWLGPYTLRWLLSGLSFYLLARGLGMDLPLHIATTAFVGAYLLGYLWIPAPGGIGVRESTLWTMLTPVLGRRAASFWPPRSGSG